MISPFLLPHLSPILNSLFFCEIAVVVALQLSRCFCHTSYAPYSNKTYGLPAEARRLIAVTVAFNAPATTISQKNKEL